MRKQETNNIRNSDKLIIANKELVFQNKEKEKRATELVMADKAFKKTEEALRKSLKEVSDYKYALDESSIVAITDQKGIIKYANENFCKISRYSAEELIGQDHRIINSGHHPKAFIKNLWVTIANGKIWKGELKNKAKDGTIYWVDTTIVPFLNEENQPYQYIAIRADITERKRVEELIVANKELASLSEEKEKRAAELILANKELVFQNNEKEKRAAELFIANKELAFQSEEKEKRAAELIVANKELGFQNEEKEKRAAELLVANKELGFQNEEKEKRAAELIVANKELAFQNEEKEKRAAELLIANKELLFQSDEKGKRAAELSETLERISFLASIADNIQDPVVSTDNAAGDNFIITRWNKPAEKLLEWKSEEVIGKNAMEIFKTKYPYENRKQIFALLKAKDFWQGEVIYHTKSGKPVHVLSTISYLKDAEGKIKGNLVLIRDITQRKKAEDALNKLNEELEQRVKQRTAEIEKNEKRFRALIENSDDIIALLDENLHPFYRSPSAERLTGYTAEDRKEEVKFDQVHPEDQEKMKDWLVKVKGIPGKAFPITYRLKHKEGYYIWLEGTFTNMFHDPTVKAIVANMRDITERKKAEGTIIKTLQEKNIILESIADAFFAVDKDWTVTYWNRIAETALSVSKQQILGKNLWEIFSDSIDSESYKKYHEAIETSQVVHFEDYYAALNRWYEISAYPSENGLSVYFKDVTERKQAEEEIKKLNTGLEEKVIKRTEELQVANREMEAFTYSVSHDLRAPLRGIIGFANILEEDYGRKLDNEAKRITAVVKDSALKMGHLIDDLLAFSRIGKQEITKTLVNTETLVNEVVDELMRQSQTPNKIYWDIKPLPPINADLNTIRQVWINLISNAVKYSGNKENQRIEIGTFNREGQTVFFIKDNGVGFDEEYKYKLFKVFQRLHDAEEFEGTGVGLALVEKIVSKHGGKVWAEGKENEGACFYFSLSQ
ncbi:MAG TPA: PAS domain S-box protein [Chitinophagaceae bacterium]|nr:PAS domain S-box protein [Chitinophagaceae bacterium]